jgi:hypothetical protein
MYFFHSENKIMYMYVQWQSQNQNLPIANLLLLICLNKHIHVARDYNAIKHSYCTTNQLVSHNFMKISSIGK